MLLVYDVECITHKAAKDEGWKKKMNTTPVSAAMVKTARVFYHSNEFWMNKKRRKSKKIKPSAFSMLWWLWNTACSFLWEIYTIKRFSYVLFTSPKELSKRKSEKWYKFRFMLYLIFYTALLILFSTLFLVGSCCAVFHIIGTYRFPIGYNAASELCILY